MTNRGTLLTAATALVAAVPVAAWGLMGQQDAEGFAPAELDYAYQPPGVSDGTAALVGAAALLLGGLALALLLRATRTGRLDPRWWQVLAPLMVTGLVIGVGYRVLTAGVVGANIGAGLTMLFGVPVVASLVSWALLRGAWLATHSGNGGSGPVGRIAPHGS
ncbi:hypothetical protein [Streptomyces sp. B93]|uniref:hypothetical protein n=1 Tax=Streptomyces sp. B93 TaxID=2824875 RepID=UPI001B35AE4C|nr:hypothetical protein [Streptomyces sp. B93]MBQ1089680.1 hypothetical protein [Streptomyces sp. B93]